MNTKINYYTLGRDLTIKKKFPSKRLFTRFKTNSELNYKTLFKRINELYSYLVNEYDKNPGILPLATSWILDNYYLISQQYVIIKDSLKPKILKKLPLSEYENLYFQVHYLAKKYLENTNSEFTDETLIPFLKGYQKIYPLSSLELWILPTILRYELLKSLLEKGTEIKEKIENIKAANKIVSEISSDIEKGKNPVKRVKKILKDIDVNPHILLSVLEDIRELDYRVEETLELIEAKVHEHDLNLEEFTRASVLRDLDLKQTLNNTITSIKNFSYINWNKLFNKVSIVESTLTNDPSNIYSSMDEISKDRYRQVIEDMSRNSIFSESEIARKVIETATTSNIDIQHHVGYHLIDKGYFEFTKKIGFRPSLKGKFIYFIKKFPHLSYIGSIVLLTVLFSFISLIVFNYIYPNYFFVLVAILLQIIPATNISVFVANKIFISFLPPALPPKLYLEKNIPENLKTLVAVPCMFSSTGQIDELTQNLEKRFLSNKFNNLFFALISDFKDSKEKEDKADIELLTYFKKQIASLNKKHKSNGFDVFYLFHRSRHFNKSEQVWMGWERKRGKLLQLVGWLNNNNHNTKSFSTIEGNILNLRDIKYIITLDEDTLLPADSALKLIGAMSHPLNAPVVDPNTKVVTRGYGFIQPRIVIDPESENLSNFTKIFVADSGYDSYSVAVSDIYQDLFNRSNFMGKGIFDVKAIHDSLGDRFSENSLLSHDLIESCYAKAGFLSDTTLLEDFPSTFTSYLTRGNRWIRGDWQLLSWLFPKNKNSKKILDKLSYWMVLDNIRRSLVLPFYLSLFIFGWVLTASNLLTVYILFIFSAHILVELFQIKKFLVHKLPLKEKYNLSLNFITSKIIFVICSFITIWVIAINNLLAIGTTVYRLIVNKHLLEWTTHSDAESLAKAKTTLVNFVISKLSIFTLLVFTSLILYTRFSILNFIIAAVWILSPIFIYYISKPTHKINLSDNITDTKKMLYYAEKIWNFFDENTNAESNYLPPDNIQLTNGKKIAFRTSPTNIGFYLLSIVSAYDLDFINLSTFVEKVENTLSTINSLPKYQGHIFNWYDIKTLQPLNLYVSTADSGNFVACLMLLESTCLELSKDEKNKKHHKALLKIAKEIRKIYIKTDFRLLYNENMSIFSIGFNATTKEKDRSYYDLLASESRIASYVAISLDQVEIKHWFKLGRPLQIKNSKYFLMSWGGTMFEYLLPTLIFNEKENTLLSQTTKQIYLQQKQFAKDNAIPWGISESNFDSFDFDSNYQYKMIGVPNLALRRYDNVDLVVSPYSTFLALMVDPTEAEINLHALENLGAVGLYGFYESLDFNRSTKNPKIGSKVKIYTAHHQGMSLVAVNNVINNRIMNLRLHQNDYIKSCEVLLSEKIPDVSNVVEPNQYGFDKKIEATKKFENERVRYSSTPNTLFPIAHIYGNEKYSLMLTNTGAGYSKFKDTFINRYTEDFTLDTSGNHIYIKETTMQKIWSATYQPTLTTPEKYETRFFAEHAEFKRLDNKTETLLNIFVPSDKNFEIRELILTNKSSKIREYEITTYSEIMLDEFKAGIAHPAFNKLFIETSFDKGMLIAKRRKRNLKDIEKYAFHFGFAENNNTALDSYETNRLNFIGRINSVNNPVVLNSNLSNSVGTTLDPIFSLRYKIKLEPGSSQKLFFVYGFASNIQEISVIKDILFNKEEINELKYLNRHYSEAKRTHLGINIKQEIIFQRVASRLSYPDYRLKERIENLDTVGKSVLYRFSISGERRLLVVKVNSKNIDLIRNMVLMHEYFRLLRFQFDLVFLIDENLSYEESLERDVYRVVESSLSMPYKGTEVYILNVNNMTQMEKTTLLSLAKVVFDTSLGSLEEQISLASRYSSKDTSPIKLKQQNKNIENNQIDINNKVDLKFENSFGGFSTDGKQYIINTDPSKHTPMPWSNIISNKDFGTVVTESGLGYTWNLNSQTNKLTPWSNDPITDPQGEILYIKDIETGNYFSATPLPCNVENFQTIHSQGYSEFIGSNNNIEHNLKVFVPQDDPVKILELKLTNKTYKNKLIECVNFVEFVLGDTRDLQQENLLVEFDATNQCIIAKNLFNQNYSKEAAFMATNLPVLSATSDREKFIGRSGSKTYPSWLNNHKRGISGFKTTSDKCGVLSTEVMVPKNSQVTIIFILGQTKNIDSIPDLIERYSNLENVQNSFVEIVDKWKKIQSYITVKTPDEKFNFLVNNWLLYQVLSCRIDARTSFYQAGGAYGFRDQLQDMMALIYANPKKVREHILYSCTHQFKEGDVQHWWHMPTNVGVRTKITDDLLWLPFVVSFYVEKTGDAEILKEEASFINLPELTDEEESRYTVPEIADEKASVYEHCMRAINRASKFGSHGIPLMGTGDWNDSLDSVGDEGKGESVWLGWFLYSVFEKFANIISKTEFSAQTDNLLKSAEKLKQNLNSNCWDGEWYLRAFYDDGTPLGSHINTECSIDSISQSWSIISGAGEREKIDKAMVNHSKYLEDIDNKLIKLLTPSFKDSVPFPGYIQGYPEGVRENGGQYTHAAIWAIKAYTMLNNGNKAYQLFDTVNSITHSLSKNDAEIYKTEPYAIAADVYSNPQHVGRGGWSWYTGSAGWMYQVAIENILGFKKFANHFELNPVIPDAWPKFELDYKYKKTKYKITVKRDKVKGVYLDGKKLSENKILLKDNSGVIKVLWVI